eukprot:Partr_v1_DN27179_c0_g1_i4_m15818 putative May act as a negative regulator of salt tolerance (By similarity)
MTVGCTSSTSASTPAHPALSSSSNPPVSSSSTAAGHRGLHHSSSFGGRKGGRRSTSSAFPNSPLGGGGGRHSGHHHVSGGGNLSSSSTAAASSNQSASSNNNSNALALANSNSAMAWASDREELVRFWLGLADEHRRQILTVEKCDLLQRMKEQSRLNVCHCDACSRRGVFMDEELEQIYDHFYRELTFSYRPAHTPASFSSSVAVAADDGVIAPDDVISLHSEVDGDGGMSWDHYDDHFDHTLAPLGDGRITVADELLAGDQRKLMIMMEHLPLRETLDFDDDDDESDSYIETEEEDCSDGDYSEDDVLLTDYEDDMTSSASDERLEESRRMFQIFAAKIMEERLLRAFQEKRAADAQQDFLLELEQEEEREKQMELKKKLKRANQKEKKRLEKLQKEADRLKREQDRLAEEEAKKLAELEKKRLEIEKKEKEKAELLLERERLRKEAEEKRRLEEEENANAVAAAEAAKAKKSKKKKKKAAASPPPDEVPVVEVASQEPTLKQQMQLPVKPLQQQMPNLPRVPVNAPPGFEPPAAQMPLQSAVINPPPGIPVPSISPPRMPSSSDMMEIFSKRDNLLPENLMAPSNAPLRQSAPLDFLGRDPVMLSNIRPGNMVSPIGTNSPSGNYRKSDSGLVPSRHHFDPFSSKFNLDISNASSGFGPSPTFGTQFLSTSANGQHPPHPPPTHHSIFPNYPWPVQNSGS